VILQVKCQLDKDETPETLSKKVRELEHEHFPKAIEKLL
jgi:phosphoribosylglycinamide formyltransferase 1